MPDKDKPYDFTGTPWMPMSMFSGLTKTAPEMPHYGVKGQVVDLLFANGSRATNCFRHHNAWAYVKWTRGHTVIALITHDPIAFMLPPDMPKELEELAYEHSL